MSLLFNMLSRFVILSAALSQHHLLRFEIAQLEFHHLCATLGHMRNALSTNVGMGKLCHTTGPSAW